MKVCLVNPLYGRNLWAFESVTAFTGARYSNSPIGLATVAALTPSHWEVEIVDENVRAIDFDIEADLIAMGPYNVQYERALEICAEFKKRGKSVAFGGPYCTLSPEAFAGVGDFRICGEAEELWPKFLIEFEKGTARELYWSDSKVDLGKSPVPRYELVRARDYEIFYLQASRGCPFSCEFCDIIVTDGRVPRVKNVGQVIREVEHCIAQGAHYITFGDANLIGNIPYARKLLRALGEYSQAHDYPVEFACELTINIAQYEDLLELMRAANFTSVFIGIESPRRESLLETHKGQNVRWSMLESIERIHSYDIGVGAGMIVGFDADDLAIFQEQFEFLQELGVPFTTCGTLVALPNTPLEKRLAAEGRMLDKTVKKLEGHGAADANFMPKQMTLDQLVSGYGWLLRSLYRYDTFSERLATSISRFGKRKEEHKRTSPTSPRVLLVVAKCLTYYLWTRDRERRHFFIENFMQVFRTNRRSWSSWFELARWMVLYPSLRNHVIHAQGIPESADPAAPPFAKIEEGSTYVSKDVSTMTCR